MAAKINKDYQNEVAKLIDWEDFKKSLQEIVEPHARVQAYMGLLRYVVPTLQSVQQDITTEQKDAVKQLLDSMSAIPESNN